MRQALKNAESPVDYTGWDTTSPNWSVAGGEFVFTFDGTTDYIGQDVGAVVGDKFTLEYKITASTVDGSFLFGSGSAFGNTALEETVGVHTIELTVSNASPTNDFYVTVFGGTTGSLALEYFRLYKNGEMVINSEGMPSAWGW